MKSPQTTLKLEEVSDVADRDFTFLCTLLDLGEEHLPSDDRLWGQVLRQAYDIQTIRRLYVRAFISLVESIVTTMKTQALDSSSRLSIAERALLKDVVCDISDKGEPKERPFLTPLPNTLRFAFKSYAKAKGFDFSPNYSAAGWEALRKVIKVRNRITHPKQIEEMQISDEEIGLVDKAHDWFVESYRGALRAHTAKLREQLSKA